MKKKFDLEKTFYAVFSIAFFFVFWWFLTTFTPAKETTPDPFTVLKMLFKSISEPIGSKVITGHMLVSLRRVLVAFSVATLIGIVLGISMGTSKWAEAIFKPIFELLRPIPPHRLDFSGYSVLRHWRNLKIYPVRDRSFYQCYAECLYRSAKC